MAKTQMTKKDRVKMRMRRRRQFTGVVFTVLILIGVGSIISALVGFISGFFDDTDERLAFASLIQPLVELDVANFSSIDKASQDTLMEAAIWASLEKEDISVYERDSNEQLLLPAVDVAKWFSKMYGPDFSLMHRTVMRDDMSYEYDETKGVYVIPVTGPDNDYMPVVEKITTSGNTKILLVSYRHQNVSLNENSIVKYKEYVMIKGSNGYYLYAIRDIEPA